MTKKVTIIVPTYNEIENIDRIQAEISKLKGNYEVIFSDGFSSDGTYEKIKYPKIQETKYRAMQMNAAAKYAKTEYLWFVHADCIFDENSILAIEESGWQAGCFTIKFDSFHPVMVIEQWCSNARVQVRKVAFGDQGIFIKRDLFEDLSGYKEIPIMEDYQLSLDLKNRGIYFKLLDLPIRASTRKFKKDGILNTIFKMQSLQHQYRQGGDIWEIARKYSE